MSLDYRNLPDAALLHQIEVTRPKGPAPVSRTKWKELVAAGLAPQPVVRQHKAVLWRWGDVRKWLEHQATGETPETKAESGDKPEHAQQSAGGIEGAASTSLKRKTAAKAGGAE
jgi:hypothetical protein